MSTLQWVVVGAVVVVAAFLTQDIWASPVNSALAKVPYLTTARSKVASIGGQSSGY